MKILIGSDHGGFDVKENIKAFLAERNVDVEDVGCHSKESVDYTDYAAEVASRVAMGPDYEGILICTTGNGMAMAANRFPNVRAALCLNAEMAVMARHHNNANVLVLSGRYSSDEEMKAILDNWLTSEFTDTGRHARRVAKISTYALDYQDLADLHDSDIEIFSAIKDEKKRQNSTINLIASENVVSRAVARAQGSVMTNKYAEGYPGKRWYNGCEYIDTAESLAIERAKELFGAEHVNVQPHCGSSANMAVYFAALQTGDKILAMSLAHGGHLTHGHDINFSGRLFKFSFYGVNRETGLIDYDELAGIAKDTKPRMIVAGASAYSRTLDFKKFREIADSVGAYLMVDMAHIAGLVAAGCHPNPVDFAEFVTSTTHKTLRGPRGGMVLCRKQFAEQIDKEVFPGLQGGPLMNEIAAKAVCFREALQPEFKQYGQQVIRNTSVMADVFKSEGYTLVSGGTDNHLMLLDLSSTNITGRDAAAALDQAGIIVNKNSIPFDTKSPFVTSGIRIGTPTVTSLGMKESEMNVIAKAIIRVLKDSTNDSVVRKVHAEMYDLRKQFSVVPVLSW